MKAKHSMLLLALLLLTASILTTGCQQAEPEAKIAVSAKEKAVAAVEEMLYPVRDNNKYGYINWEGKVAIAPQFDDAYPFSEGVARVKLRWKYGFIDDEGQFAIMPQFDYVEDFKENFAPVNIGGQYGFIDKNGNIAVEPKYGAVGSFSEGLAAVFKDSKWGYVDKMGKVVIPLQYDSAGSFKEGLAPVYAGSKYFYIDKTGKRMPDADFEYAGDFSEGLAAVSKEGKFGFIDKKGKIVVPTMYEDVFAFSEGAAAVKLCGKWGFINKKGETQIVPQFDQVDRFSEGLAAVLQGKLWGYVSKYGYPSIPPQYTFAEPFKKGRALVGVDDTQTLIDSKMNVVWREKDVVDLKGKGGTIGKLMRKKIKSETFDLLIKYPQVEGMTDKVLEQKLNKILADFSNINYVGKPGESYSQDYQVTLNKNGILSIVVNRYMYTGGAHGVTFKKALTINMEDGTLYSLKDLFKSGSDYKGRLNTLIEAQVEENDIPMLTTFKGIKEGQEFYLTDEAVVIYYQLYEYTPYAYGFPEFYIPYESVRDIIDVKGPVGKIYGGIIGMQ